MGLFFLLLVSALFAGGALYVKFKLESSRAQVERSLAKSLGAQLKMGTVSVNGLRGLQIDDLEVTLADPNGPHVTITNEATYVDINLTDLLYGKVTVDRVALNNARITVERPPEVNWYDPGELDLESTVPLEPARSFRVTGSGCFLEFVNVVGDTKLDVEQFRFDVSRLQDADDIVATLSGNLGGDSRKHMDVKLTYSDLEDFDLRVQTTKLTAEDVNVFLPSPRQLVETGEMQPTLWLNGRPGKTVVVSLHAPFTGITVQDQPDFIDAADGTLTFFATYDTTAALLSITSAKAQSDQLGGSFDGTIDFASAYPGFDLELTATHMPIPEILNYVFDGELDSYGDMELTLNEPHELLLRLTGTSEDPILTTRATAGSGSFRFAPHKDSEYPSCDLLLGAIEGTWNSETDAGTASFTVVDGTISHEGEGIYAENVYGTLSIKDGLISAAPMNAKIRGNSITGSLTYNPETGDGDATLEGKFAKIEESSFAKSITRTGISGTVEVQCTASKRKDHYSAVAEVGATQVAFDYSWWFAKPAGIVADGTVRIEYEKDISAVVEVVAEVATSEVIGTAILATADDGSWFLDSCTATSSSLDVNAVEKCLVLPYKVTGGTGTEGHFAWRRDPSVAGGWTETMGCTIDEIAVVPRGQEGAAPMVCRDLKVDATITKNDTDTGAISLTARHASAPPLGGTWFVPLRPDEPDAPRRPWTYDLSAAALEMPPWRGTNFKAEAYSSTDTSGFKSYSADIDGGHIEGNYYAVRAENSYTTDVSWSDIPAQYLLEHMKFERVLRGRVSGGVNYYIDKDDPDTLDGEGHFAVHDGEFSADFLYNLLKGKVEDELGSLPSSLEFSLLSSDVTFKQDLVRTPNLELKSVGLDVRGSGEYIKDGDMNYNIQLRVSPETAEKIPLLAENFNTQGLQIAQQNVELGFRIKGPTFNPRGELAELPPASVTLVSGASQLVGEATKLIDMPRRILIEVLKMGGGIVGSGRQSSETVTER